MPYRAMMETIADAIANGRTIGFRYPENKHHGWQPVTASPIALHERGFTAHEIDGMHPGTTQYFAYHAVSDLVVNGETA